MRKFFTLFFALFLGALLGFNIQYAMSQSTLSAGDIAIVGINCDNPDEFAFVVLIDIAPNTVIHFTDNGVKADGTFRANEGTVDWTSPSDQTVAAGTIIDINGDGSWTASLGTASVPGNAPSLSSGGDQIIAYQGSESSPTFIYALNDEGNGWQSDASNSNTSALPPGLTDGYTAIALDEVDNAVYNESVTSGTQSELLTAISNKDNWNGDNSNRFDMPIGPYTVTGSGVDNPPTVRNVQRSPQAPTSSDDVLVTATVYDDNSLSSVLLKYDAGSGYVSTTMYDDGAHGDGNANDSVFAGTIPAQANHSWIKYYVEATDNASQVTKSNTDSFYVDDNPAQPGDIVINEIMYNSAGDDTEYVEIYNNTDRLIDLSNWIFKDNDNNHAFVFPQGTSLASHAYLVICQDTNKVKEKYGISGNLIGNFSFGLNNSGDQTRLFNQNMILEDSVQYDDSDPWPTAADGNGPSLELKNPDYDNSLAENWDASTGDGTPGAKNSDFVSGIENSQNQGMIIDRYQIFPNFPNPFNPSTTFRIAVPRASKVEVDIYDITGKLVNTLFSGELARGIHSYQWQGKNNQGKPVPSGIYFAVLRSENATHSIKMMLIK